MGEHFATIFKLWVQIFLFTLIAGIVLVWVIASLQYGWAWSSVIYTMEYVYDNRLNLGLSFFTIGFFVVTWMLIDLRKKYANRTNCTVQTVTLEQLSKIWLPAERQEEEIRAKLAGEVNDELEVRQVVLSSIEFGLRPSYSFFEQYVRPNLRFVHVKELVVIRDLLSILEKEGGIPSVASKKHNPTDSETLRFESDSRGDMTSYAIYGTFSLYDHSLRVAKKMMKELEVADREFNLGWQFRIGKALVVALAHDIGKIDTIKHLKIAPPDAIRKIKNHAFVSQMMFEEIFYDYEDVKEMGELIANHHTPSKDLDRLGVLLTMADKEARKEEMNIWSEGRRTGTTYTDTHEITVSTNIAEIDEVPLGGREEKSSTMPEFDIHEALKKDLEERRQKEALSKMDAKHKQEFEVEATVADTAIPTDTKEDITEREAEEIVQNVLQMASEVPATEPRDMALPPLPSEKLAVEERAESAEELQERFSKELDFAGVFGDEEVEIEEEDVVVQTPVAESVQEKKSPGKKRSGKVAALLEQMSSAEDTSRYPKKKERAETPQFDFDAEPVPFGFSEVEAQFKEAIIANLNTLDKKGAPVCIAYKDRVLVGSEFLTKTVADLLFIGNIAEASGHVRFVADHIQEQGYLPDRSKQGNSLYSTYYWTSPEVGGKRKYFCLSIDGRYIDMTFEFMDNHRKNSKASAIEIEGFLKQ